MPRKNKGNGGSLESGGDVPPELTGTIPVEGQGEVSLAAVLGAVAPSRETSVEKAFRDAIRATPGATVSDRPKLFSVKEPPACFIDKQGRTRFPLTIMAEPTGFSMLKHALDSVPTTTDLGLDLVQVWGYLKDRRGDFWVLGACGPHGEHPAIRRISQEVLAYNRGLIPEIEVKVLKGLR